MAPSASIFGAGLYIGLNALILLWLTLHASRARRHLNVPFGDAGLPELQRALRGRASAVETIPIGAIVLYVMAATASPVWTIHMFGLVFTVARIMHGVHFVATASPDWLRDAGAFLTTLVIALGAVDIIAHAVVVLL